MISAAGITGVTAAGAVISANDSNESTGLLALKESIQASSCSPAIKQHMQHVAEYIWRTLLPEIILAGRTLGSMGGAIFGLKKLIEFLLREESLPYTPVLITLELIVCALNVYVNIVSRKESIEKVFAKRTTEQEKVASANRAEIREHHRVNHHTALRVWLTWLSNWKVDLTLLQNVTLLLFEGSLISSGLYTSAGSYNGAVVEVGELSRLTGVNENHDNVNINRLTILYASFVSFCMFFAFMSFDFKKGVNAVIRFFNWLNKGETAWDWNGFLKTMGIFSIFFIVQPFAFFYNTGKSLKTFVETLGGSISDYWLTVHQYYSAAVGIPSTIATRIVGLFDNLKTPVSPQKNINSASLLAPEDQDLKPEQKKLAVKKFASRPEAFFAALSFVAVCGDSLSTGGQNSANIGNTMKEQYHFDPYNVAFLAVLGLVAISGTVVAIAFSGVHDKVNDFIYKRIYNRTPRIDNNSASTFAVQPRDTNSTDSENPSETLANEHILVSPGS